MKRFLIVCLCCLLALTLAFGCKKKAAPTEETATPGEEAAAVIEPTDIVRLESIDYDEATKGLLLNLTKGTLAGVDTEYTITYGDSVTLPLAADAKIDFPMTDDLTKTVTITADELTEEYLAFVEEFDDKPLFTMTQADDAVASLAYVYLP